MKNKLFIMGIIIILSISKIIVPSLSATPLYFTIDGSVDISDDPQNYFNCYNKEHRHSGIVLITQEHVPCGMNKQILQHMSEALAAAFEKNPNQFKGKLAVPQSLPKAVWINKLGEDRNEI